MHQQAKIIIKDCAERNKRQEPGYESVTESMKRELKELVGAHYWKKANEYLTHFIEQTRRQHAVSKPEETESMNHDAFEASRRDGNHSIVRLGVVKRTPVKIKSKRTKKRSSREQNDASDPLDQNPSQGNNRRQRFSRERKCKQEHQIHSAEQEISHRSSAQRKRRSSSLSPTEAFQTRDSSKNYQSHTKTSMNNISVLEQLNYNPKRTLPITVDLCNVDDDNGNESYDIKEV